MKKTSWGFCVLAVIVMASLPLQLQANGPDECHHYPDVAPQTISNYGGYCGGWGYGCSECVGTDAHGNYWWCVTDGNWCATGGGVWGEEPISYPR